MLAKCRLRACRCVSFYNVTGCLTIACALVVLWYFWAHQDARSGAQHGSAENRERPRTCDASVILVGVLFLVIPLQRIPVDLIHLVVMRGLDPRIHQLRKTCEADGPRGSSPRVTAADGQRRFKSAGNRCSHLIKTWNGSHVAPFTNVYKRIQ